MENINKEVTQRMLVYFENALILAQANVDATKSQIIDLNRQLEQYNVSTSFPRRNRIDLFTPAEKAIYDALLEVEKMPADTRLTESTILLNKAREKVADFIDNIN